MFRDYFRIGLKNLRNRKLRSWLTIIGIVISVASIVALLSISHSLQAAIQEQFDKIGKNRIYIMVPGGHPGAVEGLTKKDVDTLEKIPELRYVTPYLMEPSAKIEFSKRTAYGMVSAFSAGDDDMWDVYDIKFLKGSPFRGGQKDVVIVGIDTGKEYFDRTINIDTKMAINGKKFRVVGILDRVGNNEDDRNIIIPLEAARKLFNKMEEVSFIDITVKPGRDIDMVAKKVKRVLEKKRGDENFQVLTPMQVLQFFTTTLGVVQAILVSIAAISLIVGATGIMNSMYASVMERTNEIGIMKGIGAKNRNVLELFIVEAGMVGFVGGVFGVILGMIISYGVGMIAAAAGFSMLKIKFEILLVIEGLVFAVIVGMISGALPAIRASRLKVVDALRWIR